MKNNKDNMKDVIDVFAKRLREVTGDDTQQEIGDKVGMGRGIVGYWFMGERVPNALTMYKIAKEYGVSVDYLLGLSNSKTGDAEVNNACEVTGLNENSVLSLKRLKSDCIKPDQMEALLNFVVGREYKDGDSYFAAIMRSIYDYTRELQNNKVYQDTFERLLNNAAKWDTVETFVNCLNAIHEMVMSEK